MHSLRTRLPKLAWRRTAFSLVVLLILALFGFIGVVLIRPDLVTGLFGHDTAGHISGHFRFVHHRVHDLTFGFLMGTSVVGMAAQLRAPSKNVASQWMALIPWAALGLTFLLANAWLPFAPAPVLGGLTLLAAILHPTGRGLLGSFAVARVNWMMLALLLVAAVPLVAFASANIELQRTVPNDHAALGHYGFMAAFSFTVIGAGLLGSLRADGWWLVAWVAGLLPVLLGLVSLVYPNVDSSLGQPWALAAIAWGVVFVAAAELTQDAENPTLLGSWGVISRSDRG